MQKKSQIYKNIITTRMKAFIPRLLQLDLIITGVMTIVILFQIFVFHTVKPSYYPAYLIGCVIGFLLTCVFIWAVLSIRILNMFRKLNKFINHCNDMEEACYYFGRTHTLGETMTIFTDDMVKSTIKKYKILD